MPPKKKALAEDLTPEDLIAQINKRFGEEVIGFATDPDLSVKRTPIDVYPIDELFDGGIPRGRFIELFGAYSTLKSWVAYKAIAAFQRRGMTTALIDTEHSFDPEWAEQLGVDNTKLFIMRPDTAEKGIEVMQILIQQGFDLIVFDSIAAAQPNQYREAAPGEDNAPGALARVMSRGLARLTSVNRHTSAIFINQTRNKIGVSFGSPTTTSGGVAMGYYASYRVSFTRVGKKKEPVKQWDGEKFVDTNKIVAHQIKATLEKSKLSAPYTEALFDFSLETGNVDERGYVIGKALEKGVLTRDTTGRWDIPGEFDKPIHGKAKFYEYLDENPEVIEWLKEQL